MEIELVSYATKCKLLKATGVGTIISSKAVYPQPAITCSKLTIETLEQGVKYVQS